MELFDFEGLIDRNLSRSEVTALQSHCCDVAQVVVFAGIGVELRRISIALEAIAGIESPPEPDPLPDHSTPIVPDP